MECNNIENYLHASEFSCVGLIASHCDLSKLCIATEEAKIFDIIPLFCFDFVDDVLAHWNMELTNPDYEKYATLICGGSYLDSYGKTQLNLGFKKVWIYYSYAHYLLLNQFNDTANGAVKKQNEWSLPTPLKEVNDFSNKYRNMGKEAFQSVKDYLCQNKSSFPKFDDCHCRLSCGCNGKCSCGNTKKMSGFKFSTIRK
ncbi:DUF6712 family protein [Chryseobacterium potabilaquae]|uniref:Uncharacterized protein n=1 Tax=Chryseobacterium potabilaquae TaxID=2675057 RepID=A0A6N4X762_9FLAO|nr:hypothetical protein [Chryseobacterium potabilaquae]CAA7195455.1 hypothetical protein CHRY9293_01652 [Chryseobacterium potabilaquae]